MAEPSARKTRTVHTALTTLNRRIIACDRCPRLRKYCAEVASKKTARFRDWTYWGKPVPNLIDDSQQGPRLLVAGLAPAAHGANRTGRMFTGDRSGDFLFHAMHEAGFCSQPDASSADDGLKLIDAAITAAIHCAPPGNKPLPDELANCRTHLEDTFDALARLQVIVCLGQIGHQAILRLYKDRKYIQTMAQYRFGHGHVHHFQHPNAPILLDTYHPSQQNTFTGKLTHQMLLDVFKHARSLLQ